MAAGSLRNSGTSDPSRPTTTWFTKPSRAKLTNLPLDRLSPNGEQQASPQPDSSLQVGVQGIDAKPDQTSPEDSQNVSLAWREIANERFRDDAQPRCSESPMVWFFSYYDSETGALEDVGCMRVHHKSHFRKCWDALTAFLLVWMAFSLPVTVGFKVHNEFLEKLDLLIDLAFLCDLVLGFLTTFEDRNKQTVTDLKTIAKEYLTGWFIVDFVSSLPVQWLGLEIYVPTQALRAVKMLKLLKLLRIFRLGRMIGKIQERFQIKHATVMIVQFMFIILFAAHWLGCFYFYVSDSLDEEFTWLTQYLIDTGSPIGERSAGAKYVASLYWALTTMSTIGYGDIVPISTAERLLTTVAMIIGACTFAYGLTNVCTLLFNHNRRKVEFEGLTDEFNDFLSDYKVSSSLAHQVQGYLWYCHHSSRINENPEQVDRLLSRLTPELRDRVMHALMEKIFRKHEAVCLRTLWSYFDAPFLIELSRSMTAQAHAPGEHLLGGMLSQAERMQQHMGMARICLITKGQCNAAVIDSDEMFELDSGSSFGERSVLFSLPLTGLKVVAHGYCDVYTITEDTATLLLQLYPVVKACLYSVFRRRKRDFVQASELQHIQEYIHTYLEEKVNEAEAAKALREQPMSEAERMAQLSAVVAASPRHSSPTMPSPRFAASALDRVEREHQITELNAEISRAQTKLEELMLQQQEALLDQAIASTADDAAEVSEGMKDGVGLEEMAPQTDGNVQVSNSKENPIADDQTNHGTLHIDTQL